MKAIVLSSGGLDSTTCISIAVEKYGKENVSTVSMYYGQTLDKELECARKIAEYYGLKHYEFDLSEIFKYSNCSLLKHSTQEIVEESYEQQYEDDKVISSCVPFRNGLILSTVAVLAQSLYPDDEVKIILGNHSDDFAYADCSEAFVEKMGAAIKEGTYGKVIFEAPLATMTKAEIVRTGLALRTPYELTWSCYEGKEKACGKCASCICRRDAFLVNGTRDFIEYEGELNND